MIVDADRAFEVAEGAAKTAAAGLADGEADAGARLADRVVARDVAERHCRMDRHGKASGSSRQSEDSRFHGIILFLSRRIAVFSPHQRMTGPRYSPPDEGVIMRLSTLSRSRK